MDNFFYKEILKRNAGLNPAELRAILPIMLYKYILKPILFLFSPETVHNVFVSFGEFLGKYSITRKVVRSIYGYKGPDISKTVDGITYTTPIILSAGFDYNARLTQILPSLGFGGVEIGSVTAKPCAGNTSPTLTRLPKSEALIINKGLKNDGVDVIIKRLKKTKRMKDFVIGVSIAKTNNKECADTHEAIKDYAYSFKRLNEEKVGDYYTINISCPNAFGGETFTTPDLLSQLLSKLAHIPTNKPVYIKMPISLSWEELNSLLQTISQFEYIKGVVFGNLNKDYEAITNTKEKPPQYRGGISGKPCFKPSNILIQKTKEGFGNRFTIIGCGGIFSPEDALCKLDLGSDLLQLITGMIFEGPSLMRRICVQISKQNQTK